MPWQEAFDHSRKARASICYGAWPADAYLEVQQLRYCLAMVARAVSQELVKVPSTPLNPNIRKNLYDMFSTWCDEGNLQGRPSLLHCNALYICLLQRAVGCF